VNEWIKNKCAQIASQKHRGKYLRFKGYVKEIQHSQKKTLDLVTLYILSEPFTQKLIAKNSQSQNMKD
jgi:hypothetical protein